MKVREHRLNRFCLTLSATASVATFLTFLAAPIDELWRWVFLGLALANAAYAMHYAHDLYVDRETTP